VNQIGAEARAVERNSSFVLIRSTILYTPAMLAPRIAAFAMILLLTRRLGAAEFGYFSLIGVLGEILDMSASNWVRFSLLRSDTLREIVWRDAFLRCAVLLAVTTTIACVFGIGAGFVMARERMPGFAIACGAYILSNSILRFGLTTLQLRSRRVEYSLVEVSRSAAILISAWFASGYAHPSYVAIVLSIACATFGFAAYACIRGFAGLPRSTEHSAAYRDRVHYGIPIIALQAVQYVVASSDRIFLKLIAGAASVGLYSAAYSLARVPIDVIGNALNQGGFPAFMRVYDEEGSKGAGAFVRNTFELASLLLFGVFGLSTGIVTPLARALLPAKYHAVVITILPWIAAGGVLMGLKSYVFDNIFHATRRNWLQVLTYAPAGAATITACCVFIPHFGQVGAAASFAIGAAVGLFASWLATRRLIDVKLSAVECVKALTIAVIASVVARGATLLLREQTPLLSLAVSSVLGALSWLAASMIFRPRILANIWARLSWPTRLGSSA